MNGLTTSFIVGSMNLWYYSYIGLEGVMKNMRSVSYSKLWHKLIDINMTRTELAEKSNISKSTISKMKNDEPVHLSVLLKICDLIDCDLSDIMTIKK